MNKLERLERQRERKNLEMATLHIYKLLATQYGVAPSPVRHPLPSPQDHPTYTSQPNMNNHQSHSHSQAPPPVPWRYWS
ncbi:hypothetical protein FCV25MIE_13666 [Fagus crenata]